jgi:thiol-disulfide isomerase/thioredoxin
MKQIPLIFSRLFVFMGLFVMLLAGDLFAQSATNSGMGWGDGFVKTNGGYIILGNGAFGMTETNSPPTSNYIHFAWRDYELMKIAGSGATNADDLFVEGAWRLAKDYPDRANGFQDLMGAIEHYDYEGEPDKARALAKELIASSATEKCKLWTKGFLNRLDSFRKTVNMQFTAVDGREVDLANMRGKVVLVDFWSTWCGPCVAELPRVKSAYDKFHSQGFEVIGVSCDTDKERLNAYLKEKGISWPQYFDGKHQDDNKLTVEFGVDGIPHMLLVDRNGLLRFDNVRANDKYHPKDDTTSFEEKITKLLAEKID